jgi:hypothetical protein
MGECFLEVQKVHPSEDEQLTSLLCLGVCKALAVTGSVDPWVGDSDSVLLLDRMRRSLEAALKGSHLPAKMCALHGLLYILQV